MLKGIPFDSPLYEVDEERGIEYRNCEGISAFFITDDRVEDILPKELRPYSKPPQGGIWIAHYSFSTLGEYYEFLDAIQVEDQDGNMGYYIPYIYVTNDAALAAGRELAGAPKKLAKIELEKKYDVIQGILERPEGRRLVTFTMKPNMRVSGEFIDSILPKPTLLYSIRHLPPIRNRGGVTQLIKWYADIDFHSDSDGRIIFSGPISVTYDSPSNIDPVHRIEIKEMLMSIYFEFDMRLGVLDIIKEY